MQIQEVIVLLQNKLNGLVLARQAAVNAGNMGQVIAIDADSLTTQTTLDQLLFAQQVSQEAAAQAVQAAESAPITAAS